MNDMELIEFFEKVNSVAVAFSGGVDSAYLLYMAKKYAKNVKAYYVKSQFQPQFEYEDAMRLAKELDADIKVIELDVLACDDVKKNPENRCYFCKQKIFSAIKKAAFEDGFSVLLDGTNASDSSDDRPGMKALEELEVLSPLRICKLDKATIRSLSKEAKLFTWNKPAYACLATRIKPNEKITLEALNKVENAEMFMMKLGFLNHRVRVSSNIATVLVAKEQLDLLNENKNEIVNEFNKLFDEVIIGDVR